MRGRLPDFVIIGTMRAGTTALYRYLGEHPQVFMASPKEIHFFDREHGEGLDWYALHFTEAETSQICGEATPSYLSQGTAVQRMAEAIPDSKLIAILRDPVDRAWSHFWMRSERGLETRSFSKAIHDELRAIHETGPDTPGMYYIGHGLYAHHLSRLFELYSRDSVHIMFFEELNRRPHDEYRKICQFLEVADELIPDLVGQKINSYVTFRSLRLRNFARKLPGPAQRMLAQVNTRHNVTYPSMAAEIKGELTEFFRQPNAALQQLLDVRLTSWTH